MINFFGKKKETSGSGSEGMLDPHNIPRHVAIIMDGNGRWAKKRHLPRAVLRPVLASAYLACVATMMAEVLGGGIALLALAVVGVEGGRLFAMKRAAGPIVALGRLRLAPRRLKVLAQPCWKRLFGAR